MYNKKFIHFKITLRKGTILFIHKSFVTKIFKSFHTYKTGWGGGLGCSQNLVAILYLIHFYKGKRGSYSFDKRTNILTKYYWSNPQAFTVYRFGCMYKLRHRFTMVFGGAKRHTWGGGGGLYTSPKLLPDQ